MPRWYFAQVDAEDDTFSQDYARNDFLVEAESGAATNSVLSFKFNHGEGDFASLQLEIKNPRKGLLSGPVWIWFSYEASPGVAAPILFARLIGIPSSLSRATVTLEYIGQPIGYEAIKAALADSLKVLPQWGEALVNENSRDNADAVLEGYGALWHINPVTHELTISDVLVGEDGVVEFLEADLIEDGLDIELGEVPLTQVEVKAEFAWTQLGSGSVDLTNYIVSNWPNEVISQAGPGVITSFTLDADSWPSPGASLGDGWEAGPETVCEAVYDLKVTTVALSGKIITHFPADDVFAGYGLTGDGVTVTTEWSKSDQSVNSGPGSIGLPQTQTKFEHNENYMHRDDGGSFGNFEFYSGTELTSQSYSYSYTAGVLALNHMRPVLIANYTAKRERKEIVTLTLTADVQPIRTIPEDSEAMTVSLNSVNLSETIGDGTDAYLPIGDQRRRSFIVIDLGKQYIEHMICLARAQLRARSRAVTVTFQPKSFAKLMTLSLRKNATVNDPRIPGGIATGKIISIAFEVDGEDGEIQAKVKMGCAIGLGGEVETVAGTPTYVDDDVMGPELQEFVGRRILIGESEDVGYEPPLSEDGDDGLNFQSGLSVADVVEETLTVDNPPATQRTLLMSALEPWQNVNQGQDAADGRVTAQKKLLEENPTKARLKLKSMNAEFNIERTVVVTELKIPEMIDLEAA